VIGVYVDSAGTQGSSGIPGQFGTLDMFVVMHVEATVAGAAYALTVPTEFLVTSATYGPNGLGLNVPRDGGDNIGLGECALGFNDTPVVIAQYQLFQSGAGLGEYFVTIGPNTDEDPLYPVYADCADNLLPCTGTSDLYLYGVGTETKSVGAVKALY